MASLDASFTDLQQEAVCPICREYLTDPVTLDCGHNFCRKCITEYCDTWKDLGDLECPICRAPIKKGNFRPNWQLASIVEKLKCQQQEKTLCVIHEEKLHLFCKEDNELLCLVCERAPKHKKHTVLPLDMAVPEYKNRIHSSLEVLRKKREKLLSFPTDAAKEKQELLKQTESERQKTVAVFRKLHQFLEEKEKLLLAQVEEVEKEIAACGEKHLAILSEEQPSVERLIQEMEEKYQQPANELLQDIRSTLENRQEKEPFKSPGPFLPALKWKVWELRDINPFLEGTMKQFKDTLESGLQLQKANVTLDGNTASPDLTLSEDHRSVKWGGKPKHLPDNPERFDYWPFVLGCEGFTTGRHCWEVSVGTEEDWSVGVARKSVKRKGDINFGPEGGIWEMGYWGSEYRVSGDSGEFSLSLSGKPRRIRVTLSCEGGRVAFFDADTAAEIYTHSGVSFGGEIILPSFYLFGKGHLTLSP